jgi:16S rRNA (adenine1518-N6/adenine1519-N6)-dimethyltransferase
LGQHFLISEVVCEQIVKEAGLNKSDVAIEIGTGKGALTEKIAPHVLRVISYEKDHYLVLSARNKLSKLKNVSLIEGDAFNSAQKFVPFDVCVTSLPYSRSRDFVEWLACRSGSFRVALAVIQLDFARKLLAEPSDFNYRSVSVIGQISFRMEVIGCIDRASFEPPPRVESVIFKFEPNTKFRQPFLNRQKITTLRKLFSFKGRLLRNALKSIEFKDRYVLSHPDFKSMRVEDLSPDQFASILEDFC